MKGRTGKGRLKTNSHDPFYWQRLQKQFEVCEYDHAGAYCQRVTARSAAIKKMAAEINAVEENMQIKRTQREPG